YFFDFQSGDLTDTRVEFRGSRPLHLLRTNTKVYFGEYFGNPDRSEVRIFCTRDGRSWTTCHTFKEGEIRHVHSLVYDSYRSGIWVCTGDLGDESALWYTADDFRTIKAVYRGGQANRAVSIIPLPNGLVVPMDSPLEENYI